MGYLNGIISSRRRLEKRYNKKELIFSCLSQRIGGAASHLRRENHATQSYNCIRMRE